jgi:hypothetical protein
MILGFLGTIVTILVLIKRMDDAGIDIGWLNPFTWHHRRTWRKKHQGNPAFSLEQPLDVAAMLATAVAKIDGEISKEEKVKLLTLFQTEFGKTEKEASDLLMSSIYLFGDGEDVLGKPEKIMHRSLENFSEEQASSVMSLLNAIKDIDRANANEKNRFVNKVEMVFSAKFKTDKKW